MFTFTNPNRTPNINVLCKCGRTFIQHEMYICYNCSLVFCRFCSIQEITTYMCMNCLETVFSKDAMQNKNKCSKCIACLNCKNVLSINVCNDPKSVYNKKHYAYCQYCSWDSRSIKLAEENFNDLLEVIRTKQKTNFDPAKTDYSSLIAGYKKYLERLNEYKTTQERIKRKSISLTLPKREFKIKTTWSLAELDKEMNESIRKAETKEATIERFSVKTFPLREGPNKIDGSNLRTSSLYESFYDETYQPLDAMLSAPFDAFKYTTLEQRIAYTMTQPLYQM
eukprot:TRINITY_DN311_c0_g1_i6.p1 TRINITY_DN311_c0_g1~~TRINITY_DN311_c0_g1_i6.p1  ORF type:complete len:281 (+),score=39.68 TRINITY_DN311_c0_g1_i6:169-1011(+)